MPDSARLATLLVLMLSAAVLWGRALWYFDERSRAFRRGVFLIMTFCRWREARVRAVLLSLIYYGLGALLALAFALGFGLRGSSLFSASWSQLPLIVLGVVAEVSLTELLVRAACGVTGQHSARFAELWEVPWIKGIRSLPPGWVPVAAALAAVAEETLFRGVLLRLLLDSGRLGPAPAIAICGALFCLGQFLQVRTVFQGMVIGCGCVAISAIGGLLVVQTGSVLPAVLCHACFVVFLLPGVWESPMAVVSPAAPRSRW